MTQGRVISIQIAPAAGAPMQFAESVGAVAGQGLEADRYFTKQGTYSATPGAVRDVTLIESEAVEAMNAKLGTTFAPSAMRRNIVTRGVPLNHLVGHEFRVGEVRLRGEQLCQPCGYLESLTEVGVKAAMQHRCGLRAGYSFQRHSRQRIKGPRRLPHLHEESTIRLPRFSQHDH
jgi:MOSC domain-containing protein YiiM